MKHSNLLRCGLRKLKHFTVPLDDTLPLCSATPTQVTSSNSEPDAGLKYHQAQTV